MENIFFFVLVLEYSNITCDGKAYSRRSHDFFKLLGTLESSFFSLHEHDLHFQKPITNFSLCNGYHSVMEYPCNYTCSKAPSKKLNMNDLMYCVCLHIGWNLILRERETC